MSNSQQETIQSETRKHLEKEAYERQYEAKQENSDPGFRATFLKDSELAFEMRLAELSPGARVLEIGCGDGRHAIIAAKSGATVVATDIAKEAIKLVREKAEQVGVADRVQALPMDAEHLEFPDSSFDLVIDHETFSSIDFYKVLPEIHRVLAPEGRLLGKESLGHNFFFNLNRHKNALLGKRTQWAISHITKVEDFEAAKDLFKEVQADYYHLLVLFGAPLSILPQSGLKRWAISTLAGLDRVILKSRVIQRYAFKTMFEFAGKR